MNAQVQALYRLLEPVIADAGYELWGMEHIPGPGRSLLRLYIDSAAGITLADCEQVSRRVTGVLDVEDPLPGPYDLEVSSPGLDRPLFTLAQFQRYRGREVRLRLRDRVAGRRRIAGRIDRIAGDSVEILDGDERFVIPADAIERARLVPEFES
jgi:ribosome maturation factor RimP